MFYPFFLVNTFKGPNNSTGHDVDACILGQQEIGTSIAAVCRWIDMKFHQFSKGYDASLSLDLKMSITSFISHLLVLRRQIRSARVKSVHHELCSE